MYTAVFCDTMVLTENRKGYVMNYTPDYKKAALNALKGNWVSALIVSLIVTVISGSYNTADVSFTQEYTLTSDQLTAYFRHSNILPALTVFITIFSVLAVVMAIVSLAVGGAFRLGQCIFNLNLIDNNRPRVDDLFSQLRRIGDGFVMKICMGFFIFLWALLFVIPGMIKALAYSMTPYIMAENPDIKPTQAMKMSEEAMKGKKMDLFVLKLSFFGWALLAGLPGTLAAAIITNNIMGGGNIFTLVLILPLMMAGFAAGVALSAYMSAAEAAFYRLNIAPKYTQTTEYYL